MAARDSTDVLVIANGTPATPKLLREVRQRTKGATASVSLIVPSDGGSGDWRPEQARDLVARAARAPVEVYSSGTDAYEAAQRVVAERHTDEVVVCVRPASRATRWLRRDLVTRLQSLDIPVTVIAPDDPDRPFPGNEQVSNAGAIGFTFG